jgi:hypothetical protein
VATFDADDAPARQLAILPPRVFLTVITAMKSQFKHSSCALVVPAFVCAGFLSAQEPKLVPVFKDGEAQVVDAWKQPSAWKQEHLWVQTTFDSDGDGKPDRMHVDVFRQMQTETEGLKVPVVYETSPYFAGTGSTDPATSGTPSTSSAPSHRRASRCQRSGMEPRPA